MSQEIRKLLDSQEQNIKRHISVLAEDFLTKVKTIGEQYSSIIERLDDHTRHLNNLDENVETVKTDIAFIKHELQQKISRDEFVVLEKRLNILENKFHQISTLQS